MSVEEKKRLIDRLTEAHHALHRMLDEVDLETLVYKDSGWRARDIVGHIATWDREVAKSLRAYQAGLEYLTPDLDDEEVEFNEKAVLEQRKLSSQQILNEFEQAYNEFRNAIQDIPDHRFPGDLLYPWGEERGDITTLVEYMIDHAVEHRDEIAKAAQTA